MTVPTSMKNVRNDVASPEAKYSEVAAPGLSRMDGYGVVLDRVASKRLEVGVNRQAHSAETPL
jgi:hypothetical protein